MENKTNEFNKYENPWGADETEFRIKEDISKLLKQNDDYFNFVKFLINDEMLVKWDSMTYDEQVNYLN